MSEITVDVAVIGAGTAGLSAFKEAIKVSDNVVLIDHGPLGTTCARAGCMPSKVLIQIADYYHNRAHFPECGIEDADKLSINIPKAMKHVRKLRDHFTKGIIEYVESLDKRYIKGRAAFIDKNTLKVSDKIIHAKRIILATGSSSIILPEWKSFYNELLTAETIFEQHDFKKRIAVIGAGAIGLELCQALKRLGIQTELFHSKEFIGGITDPKVNEYAINYFRKSFPLHLGHKGTIEKHYDKSFVVTSGSYQFIADQVVASLGRKPNIDSLNLSALNIALDENGLPEYDHTTLKIKDVPLYMAGDVGEFRPLLHEAADSGKIAGYNAVRQKNHCFTRRTPLSIIFTQPNIALVGQSFHELKDKAILIGEVSFEDQGRAKIMDQNEGLLRIYASAKNGILLGAEMIAPEGEHLAHMLAHAVQQKLSVLQLLQMPFYHPVLEEGVRTALRHILEQLKPTQAGFELAMCDSEAMGDMN
jgi:dihydrolipoamide dehydrogenase